jgi:hypothetical protein
LVSGAGTPTMRTSGERSVGLARAATLSTPTYSYQPSTEHFQQCAEFLPLRNRGLGTLAVTVLPIPLARRAAATACAAVQSTTPFLSLVTRTGTVFQLV